ILTNGRPNLWLSTINQKMKQLIFFCALLSVFFMGAQPSAQTELRDGSISGRIMDASLQEPLPYVNIIVKTATNELITGGITQADGTFEINKLPEGKIIVNIQYIGFKTVSKTVEIGGKAYDIHLGDVMLEEDIASLDEVTVVAEVTTIQQKVDRKVVNVGKDLTT